MGRVPVRVRPRFFARRQRCGVGQAFACDQPLQSRTARPNAWACQGSANTGPSSSRGSNGSEFRSGVLKVAVPQIKVNRVPGRSSLTP